MSFKFDIFFSNDDKMQKLASVSTSLTMVATGNHVSSENKISSNCKGLEDICLSDT